jgi:hypothetical protein
MNIRSSRIFTSARSRDDSLRPWRERQGNQRLSGFTILEMLIACAVAVIFFGMVFAFLVPCMRIFALGSVRTQIQQEALRAANTVQMDLEQGVFPGVTLSLPTGDPETGPMYLGIMRLNDVDDRGRQILKQNLVVYSWAGKGFPIIRKEWDASRQPAVGLTFDAPAGVPDAALLQIANEPTLQGKILARDVEKFRIDCQNITTDPVPPFIITIIISREDSTGRLSKESFTIKRSVDLRNQS